jgi:hypothetical protein
MEIRGERVTAIKTPQKATPEFQHFSECFTADCGSNNRRGTDTQRVLRQLRTRVILESARHEPGSRKSRRGVPPPTPSRGALSRAACYPTAAGVQSSYIAESWLEGLFQSERLRDLPDLKAASDKNQKLVRIAEMIVTTEEAMP